MRLTHIVSRQEDGLTLQQLLRGPMALSARQTRLAKQQGAVTVNAAPFFANQPLRMGMIVRVELESYPQPACPESAAAFPPEILYIDDALVAVRKPALLQCHPSPSAPAGSDTLKARVQAYLHAPAHPVHRLDAETTGIVLFARLPYVQAHLQQQMQTGDFHKIYQALCFGVPQAQAGLIDAPIALSAPDSFTRVVSADGQRAVSRYRVLRASSLPDGTPASLLELSPVTGRTHQLRVHMLHIGCPLLGDTRYYTENSRKASLSLGIAYHQLAAVSLRFIHPVTGEPVLLRCPPDFAPIPGLFPSDSAEA